jgi:hypothetical protein
MGVLEGEHIWAYLIKSLIGEICEDSPADRLAADVLSTLLET